MNGGVVPLFYGLACGAIVWLALLWAGSRFPVLRRGLGLTCVCASATLLFLFVPISEMCVWNWAYSFCSNPSLPLLGIVCAAIGRQLGGRAILKAADWRALWRFGAIGGSVLYLHPLVFRSVDLYYWGWHHEVAVWSLAILAVVPLAGGNRAGVFFLAALIAYELEVIESRNAWDHVIDPFYWLLSVGVLTTKRLHRWLARRARVPALVVEAVPVQVPVSVTTSAEG